VELAEGLHAAAVVELGAHSVEDCDVAASACRPQTLYGEEAAEAFRAAS
jgi:hypothetical protein